MWQRNARFAAPSRFAAHPHFAAQAAQEWVKDEALEAGLGQEQAQAAGARILTFGSYRLGIVRRRAAGSAIT